jgi:K+-sensing histidine kinase KdpD
MRRAASAIVLGLGGAALVLGALFPVNDRVDLSVPALLLLVPIVASSVLGGWRVATIVAVAAALGYSFGYVPPVGDIRPHVWRDGVTLVTFVLVAIACGVLAQHAARAGSPADTRLIDDRRAMLLRTVGHDLRNPLHTIQAVAAGLLSDASDERARTSLATVAAESERLDRIVANMLSASRIEAGALLPARAPEHLPALLASTIARLGLGLRVTVVVPGELPDMSVDALQFDQLLTNLLDNADRHGRTDGAIEIAAREVGGVVEIIVSDDGPGFAPSQLNGPAPFSPGSASRGVGLGLAVCRGVAEAHGGHLTLANRPEGGATVTFTLPLAG